MHRIVPHSTLVVAALAAFASASNATAAKPKNLPRYDLSVTLMPDAHRLAAEGTVELPGAVEARQSVEFALREDMTNLVMEVLEPATCAGRMELKAFGDDADLKMTKRWEAKSKQPFPANQRVRLKFSYAGGATVGLNYYLGPESCFAGGGTTAWYPQFGEYRATGRVAFTVPAGLIVKASGRLTKSEAKSSPATFVFENDRPSIFGFAAGKFDSIRHGDGPVPMSLFLLRDRPFAAQMLTGGSECLKVLAEEFGPYPNTDFAIIEVPAEAGQQSGFTGAALEGFFLVRSDFLDAKGFDLGFWGHEIGHQWWGNLVTQKGKRGEYMLDEALAQFGSLRCVERIEGAAAAAAYRRGGAKTMGGVSEGLNLMAAGFDYALGDLPDNNDGSYALSDSKGYLAFHMLSNVIGREKFQAGLKAVTQKYAYGSISWDEFLGEIKGEAKQPLTWFYAQWFQRPGAPRLSLDWKQTGQSLQYSIKQTQPLYRLEVPVQIELEDGSAIAKVIRVEKETNDFTFEAPHPVFAVRLDPRWEIFRATSEDQAQAEAMRFFTRGNLQWNHGDTEQALKTFQDGLQHLPNADGSGAAFMLHLFVGWIHEEAGQLKDAHREYDLASNQAVRVPEFLPRLYLNIAHLAQEEKDPARVRWAAANVLASERALNQDTANSRAARKLLEQR